MLTAEIGGPRSSIRWFGFVVAAFAVVYGAATFFDLTQEFVPGRGERLLAHLGITLACTAGGVQSFELRRRNERFIQAQSGELARARDEALAGSQAKSNFLATMSHEVRTPIHGLTAALDLLRLTELTDEARRRLETVQACASDACSVVDDILDFSRLEAEGVLTENVVFPVRELVTQAVDVVRAVAEQKGLTITLWFDGGVPEHVEGDADKSGGSWSTLWATP